LHISGSTRETSRTRLGSLFLIISRVGLGSGFGSKNIGPCPTHDMVGRVGLARNFVCNFLVVSGLILCVIFGLYRVFCVSVQIFLPVVTSSGRVRLDFFFRAGWNEFIGLGGP